MFGFQDWRAKGAHIMNLEMSHSWGTPKNCAEMVVGKPLNFEGPPILRYTHIYFSEHDRHQTRFMMSVRDCLIKLLALLMAICQWRCVEIHFNVDTYPSWRVRTCRSYELCTSRSYTLSLHLYILIQIPCPCYQSTAPHPDLLHLGICAIFIVFDKFWQMKLLWVCSSSLISQHMTTTSHIAVSINQPICRLVISPHWHHRLEGMSVLRTKTAFLQR